MLRFYEIYCSVKLTSQRLSWKQ